MKTHPQDRSSKQVVETTKGCEHTVYLVSCVSQKQAESALGRELYVSVWFRKAQDYVEALGCPWFILSAEYGLVSPDQVIAPYEKTLNAMLVSARRQWAIRVLAQLDEVVPNLSQVVFLAGKRYREFLEGHLRNHNIGVSVPMDGLRIGEQLSWLSRNTGFLTG
ncbi:MAG: hypothetical protein OEZ41_09765 [Nitrospirota bacterium]|nr:hypothetical protein [Nitrospirota bacterium]